MAVPHDGTHAEGEDGGDAQQARAAAAVLLYRAVTYLLPVPLGALAYLWWRHARREPVPLSGATLGG